MTNWIAYGVANSSEAIVSLIVNTLSAVAKTLILRYSLLSNYYQSNCSIFVGMYVVNCLLATTL